MDDYKIISGGRDHLVMVWDIAKQEMLFKIAEPDSPQSLAFDHSMLYVAGQSLMKHDFSPKKGYVMDSTLECSVS